MKRATKRTAQGRQVKVPGAETSEIYESVPCAIYDFEIAYQSRAGLASVYRFRGRPWPKEGLFVPRHWPSSPSDTDLPAPIRQYDPRPLAEDIVQDISRMDVQDATALLAFVNRWGLLRDGWYGEVAGTRLWLQTAKTVIGDLYALQHRRAEPPTRAEWEELGFDVRSFVGGMHFAVRATPDGLRPVFRAANLADVIGLRLFELATSAEHLRQCAYDRCRAFFIPDRRDQIYCKTEDEQRCARRASLERLRTRRRKERQRNRRARARRTAQVTAAARA